VFLVVKHLFSNFIGEDNEGEVFKELLTKEDGVGEDKSKL